MRGRFQRFQRPAMFVAGLAAVYLTTKDVERASLANEIPASAEQSRALAEHIQKLRDRAQVTKTGEQNTDSVRDDDPWANDQSRKK